MFDIAKASHSSRLFFSWQLEYLFDTLFAANYHTINIFAVANQALESISSRGIWAVEKKDIFFNVSFIFPILLPAAGVGSGTTPGLKVMRMLVKSLVAMESCGIIPANPLDSVQLRSCLAACRRLCLLTRYCCHSLILQKTLRSAVDVDRTLRLYWYWFLCHQQELRPQFVLKCFDDLWRDLQPADRTEATNLVFSIAEWARERSALLVAPELWKKQNTGPGPSGPAIHDQSDRFFRV